MWQVWAGGLLVLLILMNATWAASVIRRDASLVDRVWGLGFVLVVWTYATLGDGATPRTWLVVALVTVWGLRLSLYLTRRNWGRGEDPRYARLRVRAPESFPITSLFRIYWLQAVAAWVVSLPLVAATTRPTPATIGWIGITGTVIWAVGFGFEAVGDRQLSRFLADPDNRGKVLDRGLWRHTRHPNYFGDALVWWGLFVIALATGAWWTIAGPLLMTVILVKISGVAVTDQAMAAAPDKRDGYDDYVRRTNAFVPGPRRP
jgi:steroid 5-alpha reductase family enzyme